MSDIYNLEAFVANYTPVAELHVAMAVEVMGEQLIRVARERDALAAIVIELIDAGDETAKVVAEDHGVDSGMLDKLRDILEKVREADRERGDS